MALTLVAILILTPFVFLRAINSPVIQAKILRFVSSLSPWDIHVESLKLSLWGPKVSIAGLDITQNRTHNRIHANHLSISLNPWLATIAQLGVRDILADGIVLDLSHGTPPDMNQDVRLDWSRIVLLKNLRIAHSRLEDIQVLLPNDKQLHAESLSLAFVPTLLRDINLTLNIKKIEWQNDAGAVATIDRFYMRGETNVSHWQASAPYVNDIEGVLKLDDAKVGENTVNFLKARIDYDHRKFELSDIDILLNSHQVLGNATWDMSTEKYSATINIPQPIEILQEWDDEKVINLGGSVKGRLHFEGQHYALKEGSGKFDIDIVQTAQKSLPTNVPIEVRTEGSWSKGLMVIDPSTVKINDGTIQIAGRINLVSPNLQLPFTVNKVPLAPVFSRFNDDSFHPIAGIATGQGTIKGWGPSFVVDGAVDVAGAAYMPIVTETAHVAVTATRDKLNLKGDIYQHGRAAGRCDMALTLTHRPGKGNDILDLKASLDRYDLEAPMAALDWKGVATATYEIKGPTGNYVASGKATVLDGSIAALPYKSITTTVRMVPHQVIFESGILTIPRLEDIALVRPITLKFTPGQFTFEGHPTDNVSLRGRHHSVGNVWQLDEIAITDRKQPDWRLLITGRAATSGLNLRVHGTADAALLNVMREKVRDATGPLAIDASLSGPTSNPSITGKVDLNKNSLLLKDSPYRAENLSGEFRFNGHSVTLDNVRGEIEDGPFTITGSAQFDRFEVTRQDFHLIGKEIRYAAFNGALRMEVDADLTLSGTSTNPVLRGEMVIEDGLYTKNFSVLDQLAGNRVDPVDDREKKVKGDSVLTLDLKIRNNGDVRIRNNAADLSLTSNVTITGTQNKPVVKGSIQTEDGLLKYMGLNFTITHGLVDFRGSLDNPYIEFVGDRDIFSGSGQNYLVTVTLVGPLNNLKYDLIASPPQDKANLISLLMTGSTQDEIRNRQGGPSASTSQAAAGQVGGVLAQPLATAFHLDSVRLESNNSSTPSSAASSSSSQRLYLGKRISDRLNFEFSTDIGGANPQQSLKAEYLFTDYFLIKGGQTSNQNFGLNFILRFRERE